MDRVNDGEKISCPPCDLPESPPTLPEPEHDQVVEYSSTIDPSYIIHLIRQLLPIQTAAPKVGGDLLEDPLSGRQVPTDLESKCRAVSGEIVEEEGTVEEKGEILTRKTTDSGTDGLVNDLRASHHKESDVKNLPETNNDAQDVGGSDDFEEKDDGVASLDTHEAAAQKSAVSGPVELEELREEAGCVLWDLAANESQAEFLVDNRILDVLLAILCLPQSDRMREICLGILGNLACHTKPEMIMVNFEGLVPTVIQQLQFEDPPSLSETCRLLSAGLHSDAAGAWINALQKEEILKRIMWIAGNTMNSQLREKSTELLLAIVDSKQEAFSVLLPTLLRMGLPELLTGLIEGEVTAITEGTSTCGDAVLDIVLQIAEALSLADEFATQLASNERLFSLACQVIRLSQKDEVGPSGITGTVLIANLLTEKNSLIGEFLQDGNMITHLIGLLPLVTEDSGARNALWSILQRVCQHVQANQPELPSDEHTSLMAAFAEGSNLLMDDLDDHRDEDEHEDEQRAPGVAPSCGRQAKINTIANIVHILEDWLASDSQAENRDAEAVRAAQNACQLLRNYSISPDSVMHDQVLGR